MVLKLTADKTIETCEAVSEMCHCHMIRKTKAMDLYKNGVPLQFIMQIFVHESISTISGFYAFATLEMMYDSMNKVAPTLNREEKFWKKTYIKNICIHSISLKILCRKYINNLKYKAVTENFDMIFSSL